MAFAKLQNQSVKKLRSAQRSGKVIVFTNGCYDLIHAGHIRYLKSAKKLGDILVVGINSDASVRRLKGKDRPILKLTERMEILNALACVDYVIPFSEETPYKLISLIKPKVLTKGGDWKKGQIVGEDIVLANGGRVVQGVFVKGRSTTEIIRVIQGLDSASRA
ncbi:MAG: rfaE bifunctional protein nucleotidyltransferase chain/domain [Candidatus Omnitrophota bacterium]